MANLIEQFNVNNEVLERFFGNEYKNDPEFVQKIMDQDGHIVRGIRDDGSEICYIKTHIENGLYVSDTEINSYETPEYIKMTTDLKGHILNGIKTDGTTYIAKIENETIAELVNRLKTENNLNYVLNISESKTFLNSTINNTIVDYFNKNQSNPGIYLGYNIIFENDSILDEYKISLYNVSASDVGSSFDFFVGTVDLRNWFLPRITISKKVKKVEDGLLCFDFSNDRIVVNKNEVIFIYAHQTTTGAGSNQILSIINNSTRKGVIKYAHILTDAINDITSNMCSYPDARIFISIRNFDAIFPTKYDFDILKNNVDNISTQLKTKQNSIIIDNVTGEKYKIIISNGELTTKNVRYSRILCIGNSYTKHSLAEVWPSDGRSMAASIDACMYATHLSRLIGCPVDRANWALERTLTNSDFTVPNANIQYDAIILQLGENIISTNTSEIYLTFVTAYRALKTNWPNADIFGMFGKMYGNKTEAVCHCIELAALDEDVPLVDCSQVSLVDHYQHRDYVSNDNGQLVEVNDAVYASHPSDAGMYAIGNKLLELMGYDTVTNRKYNITKVQTTGGSISTAASYWISEGIVTIRCNPSSNYRISNMSVVDSDGQTIPTAYHNATYQTYTFVMPAKNVTITPTWSAN